MQKKIIALAVAGLASGAVFAQTNVTIYGVADLGQAWVKSSSMKDAAGNSIANQKTVSRLDSNSSLLGFKGVEDLGNGLKAVFQFESNIAADYNGGFNGVRDSYVGLAGGFGTVVGGRLTHPLREMGVRVDILPGDAGIGTTNSVTGTLHGIKTGADDRASNAIAYVTPTFGGGFSGTVAYVNGERKTNDNPATLNVNESANARAWQIAGKYDNGPLFVGLGYHKTKDNVTNDSTQINTTTPAPTALGNGLNARVWRIAAVYTAPFATRFSALYDNTKVSKGSQLVIPGTDLTVKRSAWSIGAAHPFGANTVGLQYGRSGKTGVSGSDDLKDKASIWTAYYGYTLSKRTLVQARYTRLKNDKGGNVNFYNNPVVNNGATAGVDGTYSGFMVGLRHSF